jgi:hypothetical protein
MPENVRVCVLRMQMTVAGVLGLGFGIVIWEVFGIAGIESMSLSGLDSPTLLAAKIVTGNFLPNIAFLIGISNTALSATNSAEIALLFEIPKVGLKSKTVCVLDLRTIEISTVITAEFPITLDFKFLGVLGGEVTSTVTVGA